MKGGFQPSPSIPVFNQSSELLIEAISYLFKWHGLINGGSIHPFGPAPGVTSSVAPVAFLLTPRPGSADCAATVDVRAREATVTALMKPIV
jgi:hypothetical protein